MLLSQKVPSHFHMFTFHINFRIQISSSKINVLYSVLSGITLNVKITLGIATIIQLGLSNNHLIEFPFVSYGAILLNIEPPTSK